jgi:hypothetical protein
MASNQQIIHDLQLIMETDQLLELLTTYKGVPFTFKAKVKQIDKECAQIEVKDPAMVCLEYEKRIKLLGSDYFEPASGIVQSFDILTGSAELGNFSYLGAKLGERMIVRVEPKNPIAVLIETENQSTPAEMADLSINGMGVRIPYSVYKVTLKPGTTVQLGLSLPEGKISLSGMVLSAAKTDEFYRLSVRFNEIGSHNPAIFNYLIVRRAEIENELKEEYERVISKKA